jgi:hypothetical protein
VKLHYTERCANLRDGPPRISAGTGVARTYHPRSCDRGWVLRGRLSWGVVVAAAWKQVFGGAIFTGAGTAALLGLFAKIQAIGRDQAMLVLVPTKYELALQFATTPEDRKIIL